MFGTAPASDADEEEKAAAEANTITEIEKIKSLYLKNNGTKNILVYHYDNYLYYYTLSGILTGVIHTLSLDSTNSKKTAEDE